MYPKFLSNLSGSRSNLLESAQVHSKSDKPRTGEFLRPFQRNMFKISSLVSSEISPDFYSFRIGFCLLLDSMVFFSSTLQMAASMRI
jgi:hypothetical protein